MNDTSAMELEKLLTEYSIADAEVRRAVSRRHDALHAVRSFMVGVERDAYNAGVDYTKNAQAANVPTGTQPPLEWDDAVLLSDAEIARGYRHSKRVAPAYADCPCVTCCEARTLANVGKDTVGEPNPPPKTP